MLKAGVPVAAETLAVANIPAVACFPAIACFPAVAGVSNCMAHGHFHVYQFPRTSNLKTGTFLESGRDDGHLAPLALVSAHVTKDSDVFNCGFAHLQAVFK